MENATKGLIIAASVLIALMLITIGIRMVNSTRGTIKQTEDNLSDAEVDRFNSQFEAYEGTGIRGTVVKQLARKVIQLNEANIIDPTETSDMRKRYDYSKIIRLDLSDRADAKNAVSKKVILDWLNNDMQSKALYNISITNYKDNGRVDTIKVRYQKSS